MKTAVNNFRLLAAAMIVLFSISFATTAQANNTGEKLPVVVKCIGYENESPIFHVSFANEAEEEFLFTIKDVQGNLIYSDRIKGTSMQRKFKLVSEDVPYDEFNFEFTNLKTNTTVKYKVVAKTRIVNDTEVTKVK
jgi:hypothetical protein